MSADHYAALGLAANASLADIKKAFRQKASFYHPDRNDAPDAAQRFQAVQKAYEVLSDDTARQAYDDNLGATCWTTRCRPRKRSGKPIPRTFFLLLSENFPLFP